jgi:hypothetical protein
MGMPPFLGIAPGLTVSKPGAESKPLEGLPVANLSTKRWNCIGGFLIYQDFMTPLDVYQDDMYHGVGDL